MARCGSDRYSRRRWCWMLLRVEGTGAEGGGGEAGIERIGEVIT
uniref:Uncharacterized protein n=1 Tax=Arundo donax TaxID=35708 RepID=A0A0A9EG99_ARUDO